MVRKYQFWDRNPQWVLQWNGSASLWSRTPIDYITPSFYITNYRTNLNNNNASLHLTVFSPAPALSIFHENGRKSNDGSSSTTNEYNI